MAPLFRVFWMWTLMLGLVPCHAQTFGTLRLTITDQSSHPLAHASVRITEASRERGYPRRNFWTDGRGQVEAILTPGRYWVEVTQRQFEPGATVVEVEEGRIREQSIHILSLGAAQVNNPYRGASEGSLSGSVFDPSGAVIPEAALNLQRLPEQGDKNTYPVFRVTAGSSGNFEIPLVGGSYSVEATHFGFAPQKITVRISSKGRLQKDFILDLPPVPVLRMHRYVDEHEVPTSASPTPAHIEPNIPKS